MELNKFNGKRLLVLSGASVHLKLVRAAKELGAYVVVADYLEDSPCKKLSDESWMTSITDVDCLVAKSKTSHIDGVVAGWIDPAQKPYCQVCGRLGLPCLGTSEQFANMTNKHLFKQMCRENGVGVIPEYTLEKCEAGDVDYPVFVKPVDSRGSRGQSVCYNHNQLREAIAFAQSQSSNHDVLVERYMRDCHEVQVTYFYVNGVPHLIRMADSYTGTEQDRLEKVVQCSISPSRFTEEYLRKEHGNVIRMFSRLGIKNGPIFMQGFEKDGRFYFFDPGLRFPGVDYETTLKKVFGVDLMRMMVVFSLTGEMPDASIPDDAVFLNGQASAILFPTICAGKVKEIHGYDILKRDPRVVSLLPRVAAGDTIPWTFNVNQRLAEIDLLCDGMPSLKAEIQNVENQIDVVGEDGSRMIYGKFDLSRIQYLDGRRSGMKRVYSIRLLSERDLLKAGCFDIATVMKVCEEALVQYRHGKILFPHKVAVVFDEKTQERINCLPAAVLPEKVYGMKWISVFPQNPHIANKPNISALTLLSELDTGYPVALLEAGLCTSLRTSAVGAIAARYLAKRGSRTIGIIGAGEQAKAHLVSMKCVLPQLRSCRVASRSAESEAEFVQQMHRFFPDMAIAACHSNYRQAVEDADVIVTAISGQEKILQADWISEGAFYCHVAGLEDDFAVAKKASKIVCDDWETVKGRSQTISQMYQQGLLGDNDIYADLHELILGEKSGRENDKEFIYFNSVGLSFLDVKVANWMYSKALKAGLGQNFVLRDEQSIWDNPDCLRPFDVAQNLNCCKETNYVRGGGYHLTFSPPFSFNKRKAA